MKALIQTGSSGRVPVPPEKRFLINPSNRLQSDTCPAWLRPASPKALWWGASLVGIEKDESRMQHSE